MKPVSSMFTFRLPWCPGKSTFFKGDIKLPVWGLPTTTECKIIVPSIAETESYDHTTYENQMFFFNTVQRTCFYKHNVKREGLDQCYDCKAEIEILRSYVEKYLTLKENETVEERIEKISAEISAVLDPERTLLSAQVRFIFRFSFRFFVSISLFSIRMLNKR
jgi:hypothetical protein